MYVTLSTVHLWTLVHPARDPALCRRPFSPTDPVHCPPPPLRPHSTSCGTHLTAFLRPPESPVQAGSPHRRCRACSPAGRHRPPPKFPAEFLPIQPGPTPAPVRCDAIDTPLSWQQSPAEPTTTRRSADRRRRRPGLRKTRRRRRVLERGWDGTGRGWVGEPRGWDGVG